MYYAIYWRYHSLRTEINADVFDAISTLYHGADASELSAVGYYDSAANILYIHEYYWDANCDGMQYSKVLGLAPNHTYADIVQINIDDLYEHYIR